MGESQMGDYSFSSWPIHLAFVIALSNVWGLLLQEWKGTSARTKFPLLFGLVVLLASTLVIAYGSHVKELEASAVRRRNPEMVEHVFEQV